MIRVMCFLWTRRPRGTKGILSGVTSTQSNVNVSAPENPAHNSANASRAVVHSAIGLDRTMLIRINHLIISSSPYQMYPLYRLEWTEEHADPRRLELFATGIRPRQPSLRPRRAPAPGAGGIGARPSGGAGELERVERRLGQVELHAQRLARGAPHVCVPAPGHDVTGRVPGEGIAVGRAQAAERRAGGVGELYPDGSEGLCLPRRRRLAGSRTNEGAVAFEHHVPLP